MTSLPKPATRGPKPPSRIRRSAPVARKKADMSSLRAAWGVGKPPCRICKHTEAEHHDGADGCSGDGPTKYGCGCNVYEATRTRKPAQARKAKPRKLMPKCRHCAHPESKHGMARVDGMVRGVPEVTIYGCLRCASCPGYEPTRRGSKASRRAPIVALRKQAKELWSKCVRARPGGCECPRAEHTGFFQGAHGWTKKSYPGVRYDLRNGWKLTNDCHRYFTDHPIEWDDFMRASLGPEEYDRLRRDAVANVTVDLEAKVIELRAELARLEGA